MLAASATGDLLNLKSLWLDQKIPKIVGTFFECQLDGAFGPFVLLSAERNFFDRLVLRFVPNLEVQRDAGREFLDFDFAIMFLLFL